MKFEELQILEKMGKNRAILLLLEKENKYVFHGSPHKIKILEPKQSKNMNKETGNMENHGEPSVFATQYADFAIFRALINNDNVIGSSESSFVIEGIQMHFSTTKNLMDAAKKKVGKVYVLDKKNFQDIDEVQCISNVQIVPLKVIEVTFDDLPEGIKVLNNYTNI
jgi:predicted methyltransferase